MSELIPKLAGHNVLVVGDVMLDRYVHGDTTRLSPEAPVPVLVANKRETRLGGAANVAAKICELGSHAVLVGVIGADAAGKELLEEARRVGIDCSGLVIEADRQTTVKTRYIVNGVHAFRVDDLTRTPITLQTVRVMRTLIAEHGERVTSVVIVNHDLGTLPPAVIDEVVAHRSHASVVVDPRGKTYVPYRDVVLVPNVRELETVLNASLVSHNEIEAAGRALMRLHQLRALVVKCDAGGITLFCNGIVSSFAAPNVPIRDVTGAGDVVTAVYATALAAGIDLVDASVIACAAGGLIVQQLGVGHLEPIALANVLQKQRRKIMTVASAANLSSVTRAAGRRVVFTNGVFDMLHPGHIALLRECRRLGDLVIVALNSDASTRRLKGPTRPIMSLYVRAAAVAELETVDAVITQKEDTPHALLIQIHPDVLAKGPPYVESEIVGGEIVRGYGGTVVRVQHEAEEYHTSDGVV